MQQARKFERFGRYVLLHRLAVGGMAEIFLAIDPAVRDESRLLVVKRIREELSANKDFLEMFQDEERVISQLSHPNIIRLLDFGQVGHRFFIALEHVWGESLATLTQICANRRMPVPLFAALYIASKVASALQHAHQHHDHNGEPSPVIHRDVTLGNVVVSYSGEVKVLDFGIAKAKDRIAHTRAGQIKGTLTYLAPEQLLGEEVGPYTDIYQLGVLLYQTLVGRAPVSVKGEIALMKAIVAGQIVKPTAVAPDFPQPVERMLLRAMARKPEHRYPDAGELAGELLELMGTMPIDSQQRMAGIVTGITGERRAMQEAFIRNLIHGLEVDREASDLFMWATSGETNAQQREGVPVTSASHSVPDSVQADVEATDPTMVVPPVLREELSQPSEASESLAALLPELDFLDEEDDGSGASGVFISVKGGVVDLDVGEVPVAVFEPADDDEISVNELRIDLDADVFRPESPAPITMPDIQRPADLLDDMQERDLRTVAEKVPARGLFTDEPTHPHAAPPPPALDDSGIFRELLDEGHTVADEDLPPELDDAVTDERAARLARTMEATRVVARDSDPAGLPPAADYTGRPTRRARLEVLDETVRKPRLEVLEPNTLKPALEVLVREGEEAYEDFSSEGPTIDVDLGEESGELDLDFFVQAVEPDVELEDLETFEPGLISIVDQTTDVHSYPDQQRPQVPRPVPGVEGGFDINQAMTYLQDADEITGSSSSTPSLPVEAPFEAPAEAAAEALVELPVEEPIGEPIKDPVDIFSSPTLHMEDPGAGAPLDLPPPEFSETELRVPGASWRRWVLSASAVLIGVTVALYLLSRFGVLPDAPGRGRAGAARSPLVASSSDAGAAPRDDEDSADSRGASDAGAVQVAVAPDAQGALDPAQVIDASIEPPVDAAPAAVIDTGGAAVAAAIDAGEVDEEQDEGQKEDDRASARRRGGQRRRTSTASSQLPPPPPPPPVEKPALGELVIDPGPNGSVRYGGSSRRGSRAVELDHDRGKIEVGFSRPAVEVSLYFHVMEDGVKLRLQSEPPTEASLNGIEIGVLPKSLVLGRRFRVDLDHEDFSRPVRLLIFYRPND